MNRNISCHFEIKIFLHILSGCEKHGVHSSKTSYFVCGTSVSLCLLIQRTSKHLGHNSSAHFSGQAINHACSFSSFQLAQRTSRVKSWTRKTEDSLAHWTSASQSFFLALIVSHLNHIISSCLWIYCPFYSSKCKLENHLFGPWKEMYDNLLEADIFLNNFYIQSRHTNLHEWLGFQVVHDKWRENWENKNLNK